MRRDGARSQNKRETQRGKCRPPTAKATLQPTAALPRAWARKWVPVGGGRGPRSPSCPHPSESTHPVALPNAEISAQDHSLGLPPPSITKSNHGLPGNDLQEQHPAQDPQS